MNVSPTHSWSFESINDETVSENKKTALQLHSSFDVNSNYGSTMYAIVCGEWMELRMFQLELAQEENKVKLSSATIIIKFALCKHRENFWQRFQFQFHVSCNFAATLDNGNYVGETC